MTIICCEFTPRQLDVIQSALRQAASHNERARREIMDAYEAAVKNRAYGKLKKHPEPLGTVLGAFMERGDLDITSPLHSTK